MSISIDSHRDVACHGETTFRTVLASHPSDYECKPKGVLSYCHLEVGTDGDVIVVRLGKHRVLDELTVNKISDELLGWLTGQTAIVSSWILRGDTAIECDSRKVVDTPQENGVQRGEARAVWSEFTASVGFCHHKVGLPVQHHGQRNGCHLRLPHSRAEKSDLIMDSNHHTWCSTMLPTENDK